MKLFGFLMKKKTRQQANGLKPESQANRDVQGHQFHQVTAALSPKGEELYQQLRRDCLNTCSCLVCKEFREQLALMSQSVLAKHSTQTDLRPAIPTSQTSSHKKVIRPGERHVMGVDRS